ncbi:hypothetical protein EVAR_48419_1 [Eumeta japonica]|uniref:Uncharacterized protein n=1 Tax=Eumeta variegata TaxID=151549 RepID=A0A4C1XU49_EUMVA|nr:hypothetical protein EVAR_48419_1 [Eumeta japonica]
MKGEAANRSTDRLNFDPMFSSQRDKGSGSSVFHDPVQVKGCWHLLPQIRLRRSGLMGLISFPRHGLNVKDTFVNSPVAVRDRTQQCTDQKLHMLRSTGSICSQYTISVKTEQAAGSWGLVRGVLQLRFLEPRVLEHQLSK